MTLIVGVALVGWAVAGICLVDRHRGAYRQWRAVTEKQARRISEDRYMKMAVGALCEKMGLGPCRDCKWWESASKAMDMYGRTLCLHGGRGTTQDGTCGEFERRNKEDLT